MKPTFVAGLAHKECGCEGGMFSKANPLDDKLPSLQLWLWDMCVSLDTLTIRSTPGRPGCLLVCNSMEARTSMSFHLWHSSHGWALSEHRIGTFLISLRPDDKRRTSWWFHFIFSAWHGQWAGSHHLGVRLLRLVGGVGQGGVGGGLAMCLLWGGVLQGFLVGFVACDHDACSPDPEHHPSPPNKLHASKHTYMHNTRSMATCTIH